MMRQGFSILILAAGKATRFKSDRPKLLHPLAGRVLGEFILRTSLQAQPDRIYMIVGHQAEQVRKAFERPGLAFIEQEEQLGTGHALIVARAVLEQCPSPLVVVVVGDAPLLESATLLEMVETHAKARAACTVLTTVLQNPRGYGRIVRSGGNRIRAIVEERIATPALKKIREVNSGILCFTRRELLKYLDGLSRDNAQKEYLLTDLVAIFNRHRLKVVAHRVSEAKQVCGINDRAELAQVEKTLQLRKNQMLMREGVTITDPDATYIDLDVEVGRDTTIAPGVSLRGGTHVGIGCRLESGSTISDSLLGDRVIVRPCCVIADSEIGSDAAIGPFAHLRDSALIAPEARIGNYVEVKKSKVGKGTKALHLTYLGDATVGEGANIGAGTVTCNYDGEKKNPTVIEDEVFIGSGNMLVAPVRIGKGSYTAAGSTITEDVPPDSLALGRAQQVTKEGWVREHKKVKPHKPGPGQ